MCGGALRETLHCYTSVRTHNGKILGLPSPPHIHESGVTTRKEISLAKERDNENNDYKIKKEKKENSYKEDVKGNEKSEN